VILVVEDDEDTRKMLLDALRAEMDVRVTTVTNGQAALDVIALQPPALVLLDLNLPVVHGLEVVRRLRANPGSAAIPVVALTAHGRRAPALAAGCDDFVAKPFAVDDLVARLGRWLDRRQTVVEA
jgi:CheY-like chemotaxis protein